jgi:hypothetical protein
MNPAAWVLSEEETVGLGIDMFRAQYGLLQSGENDDPRGI